MCTSQFSGQPLNDCLALSFGSIHFLSTEVLQGILFQISPKQPNMLRPNQCTQQATLTPKALASAGIQLYSKTNYLRNPFLRSL